MFKKIEILSDPKGSDTKNKESGLRSKTKLRKNIIKVVDEYISSRDIKMLKIEKLI